MTNECIATDIVPDRRNIPVIVQLKHLSAFFVLFPSSVIFNVLLGKRLLVILGGFI